jgi:uncharacterized protein YgiB involved in biofilm formation
LTRALLLALALVGCAPSSPQARRERLTAECIHDGHNPHDCAAAWRDAIPQ